MRDDALGGTWTPAGQYFLNISISFGGPNVKSSLQAHTGPTRCTGLCPSGLRRSTGGQPWVWGGLRALETAICMAVLAASRLWGSPGAGIDAGPSCPAAPH